MVTGKNLIPMLVDIFVARRMTDKDGDPSKPWLRSYLAKPVTFDFFSQTREKRRGMRPSPKLTVAQLLRVMKLNWELTDACSQLVQQVNDNYLTKKNTLLVSYVMSRCTGRKFLKYSAEHGPNGATVLDILKNAWAHMQSDPTFTAADFSCEGFNPQKCMATRPAPCAGSMQFLSVATLRDVFHISARPGRVNLKSETNELRGKRLVMKDRTCATCAERGYSMFDLISWG